MTSGFEHFDVEADVGVRAWGPARGEAFAQAALGVFALIVPPAEVVPRETREVRAQGDSVETLLVNWINECLYLHDIEGFVVHRVGPVACDERVVHGVLHGEAVDAARHHLGTIVKGATFHQLEVLEHEGLHQVRIIVDV
ncbi:MAG: archease [Dehalococcoidia bacterium]|nr:archease [Dehalococcoidia bacterium]